MKKTLASLAFMPLLALSLGAAQDSQALSDAPAHEHGERRRPDPKRQLEMLTKKLNLSADQQTQILPILTDRDQQVEALHKDTSMSRDDMRTKMRTIRTDSRAKLEAVLTADQKKTFEEMEQSGQHREAPAGAPQN